MSKPNKYSATLDKLHKPKAINKPAAIIPIDSKPYATISLGSVDNTSVKVMVDRETYDSIINGRYSITVNCRQVNELNGIEYHEIT